mgnify:CR=1 FL=1
MLTDADAQPNLTKHYPLAHKAPAGLVEAVMRGAVDADFVSHTRIPGLHLVKSNDCDGALQHWLKTWRVRSRLRVQAEALINSPRHFALQPAMRRVVRPPHHLFKFAGSFALGNPKEFKKPCRQLRTTRMGTLNSVEPIRRCSHVSHIP